MNTGNTIDNTARTQYLTIAQKAIETTLVRSKTLLTRDGYTIDPIIDEPGKYIVARSANDARVLREGESAAYTVDIINQDCGCRQWEFRNCCKHLSAVNEKIAECARLMGPMLPVAAPVSRVVEKVEAVQERTFPKRGTETRRQMIDRDFC